MQIVQNKNNHENHLLFVLNETSTTIGVNIIIILVK